MSDKILVIDDQELMRESLRETLNRAGYEVQAVGSGREGLERFERDSYSVVITDLRMPDVSGMKVLTQVNSLTPEVPVIVITGHGSIENAVEAMKHGAFDYITKPFDPDRIEILVQRALRQHQLVCENESMRSRLDESDKVREMVSRSPALKRLFPEILKIANSSVTVLVQGESGTGKEVVAKAIHYSGSRRSKPFLAVNCAALSAGLLESELFGHEKGAFTGADRMRKGRFELADGGTLLLDEIGEIDPGLQAKLLRVMQEKRFERVGSSASRAVDVRIVATTNKNLQHAVREKKFREDLYFRLNVIPFCVPPLRERREDILSLTQYFLERVAAREGRPVKRITPDAAELLMEYSWPGNVRELENLMERASVLDFGDTITVELIRPWLDGAVNTGLDRIRAGMPLEEAERILIERTLDRYNGHRERTARALGIGVRTLGMKIKKWGLTVGRNCAM